MSESLSGRLQSIRSALIGHGYAYDVAIGLNEFSDDLRALEKRAEEAEQENRRLTEVVAHVKRHTDHKCDNTCAICFQHHDLTRQLAEKTAECESLLAAVPEFVTACCDDLKVIINPEALCNTLYDPDHCGHSIAEHTDKGCGGEWFHSRCGSEHDCDCKQSREQLITRMLDRWKTDCANAAKERS